MSTQALIRDGLIVKLKAANPELEPARVRKARDVRINTEEELLRFIPPTVGKRLFVLSVGKAFQERADRAHDRHAYSFGVLGIDRLDPPNEHLLNPDHEQQLSDWADERIAWVDEKVYRPLAATNFAPIAGAFIETATITEIIDDRFLQEHGIFWSSLAVSYSIIESNH